MRKRSGLILVFVLGVCGLFAQAPKSSLLWEISGNGLKKPSYVFGTFHIMCKEDFVVSAVLQQKIQSAGQFYGEIKLDDDGWQTRMMSKMVMPGKTIHSFMTDDEFTALSAKFLEITGMPMSILNNFKPFMAYSLLALKTLPCKETVQPETEMMNVAKQNKLAVMGLESIEEQMNVIDAEPLDSQIADLKNSVMNYDSVRTSTLQLVGIYKKRNIDSLYSFMKTTGISEDFEMELLDKRNLKWIPIMQKAMVEKPSFFAVGSGHLGGPGGVINLLRKQGYKVKPLQY